MNDPSQYSWVRVRTLHDNKSREVHNSTLNEYYTLYEQTKSPMTNPVQTLYSFTVDGQTRYGIHIGTNSKNQYLIEEKTTCEIHTLNKEDLEEVLPYTFDIRYPGNPTKYSFIGEPDTVVKGDVLLQIDDNRIQQVVVVEVDTKSKKATKRFSGVKLLTQPL
jgi:hypothetical protein